MGLNNTIFTNESPGLFNGNIAAMMTDIKILATEEDPNVSIDGYAYDQLHRIKKATNYRVVGMGYEGTNMYNTNYSYDPDGNLTNLQRGGQEENNVMDRLSYVYGLSSRPNQLTQVNDLASDGTPGQFSGTEVYDYDQIGNLTETTSNGNLTKIDWDVYNKVKQVTNEDLLTRYLYDGAGNRVLTFKNVGFEERRQQITAYSRDASGNTLAVYDASDGESYPYGHPLEEMYVFGSSRIGVDKTLRTDDRNPGIFIYHKDLTTTHYEISNHLGNVLTTVTGRKLGQVQNDVLDHYLPEVVTATDYYAFGAQMPGRSYENTTLSGTNGYRYAFNGKEHDSDGEFGSLTHYDYGFRVYNPSIGKFLSVDPLADEMPAWSPFNYVFNNPIKLIDPDGRAPSDGDGTENEYIRTWNATTNSYDTKQISTAGGDNYDIIHTVNGRIPEVGTTVTTDVVLNDTYDGYRASPGVFVEKPRPFMPATGALQTLDGGDDPIFNIITLGQGAIYASAASSGDNVLGFAAFRYGDDVVKHSAKALIKKAQLPHTGKIRFVPRKEDVLNGKLLRQDGGYTDKFGNIWKKGPSRTKGEDFEWDVTLYPSMKDAMKWLSRSGNHLNVSLKGKITH